MRKAIVLASLTCLLASCEKPCCQIPYIIEFNTYSEWSYFYGRYKEIYPERYLVPKQGGHEVLYRFFHISTEPFLDENPLFEVEYEDRGMMTVMNLGNYEFYGHCLDAAGIDTSDIEIIDEENSEDKKWHISVTAGDKELFYAYSSIPDDRELFEQRRSVILNWLTNGIEDIF